MKSAHYNGRQDPGGYCIYGANLAVLTSTNGHYEFNGKPSDVLRDNVNTWW